MPPGRGPCGAEDLEPSRSRLRAPSPALVPRRARLRRPVGTRVSPRAHHDLRCSGAHDPGRLGARRRHVARRSGASPGCAATPAASTRSHVTERTGTSSRPSSLAGPRISSGTESASAVAASTRSSRAKPSPASWQTTASSAPISSATDPDSRPHRPIPQGPARASRVEPSCAPDGCGPSLPFPGPVISGNMLCAPFRKRAM